MASFKPSPSIATKRDISKAINKRPSNEVTEEDLELKPVMSDEEAEAKLNSSLKPLVVGETPEPVIEAPKPKEEAKPVEEKKPEKKAEETKKEEKPAKAKEPKKAEPKKEEKPAKVEEPKKVEPKEKKPAAKPAKEEKSEEAVKPVEEAKPVEKTPEPAPALEAKPEEPARPLTPEEKKAKQLENLRKAREAAQARKASEQENMATKPVAKKPVAKPKQAVDMSKMMTMSKKPTTSTGKTCYHVSKRGETLEDRVWKVFIQESNKVIKLFDTQAEALDYAKSLAKNKNDGSYVILHGLDGKIRKF